MPIAFSSTIQWSNKNGESGPVYQIALETGLCVMMLEPKQLICPPPFDKIAIQKIISGSEFPDLVCVGGFYQNNQITAYHLVRVDTTNGIVKMVDKLRAVFY